MSRLLSAARVFHDQYHYRFHLVALMGMLAIILMIPANAWATDEIIVTARGRPDIQP